MQNTFCSGKLKGLGFGNTVSLEIKGQSKSENARVDRRNEACNVEFIFQIS